MFVLGESFELGNAHSKPELKQDYPPEIPKSNIVWNERYPSLDSFHNCFLERGEFTPSIWNVIRVQNSTGYAFRSGRLLYSL
jgi:hypothetical protein